MLLTAAGSISSRGVSAQASKHKYSKKLKQGLLSAPQALIDILRAEFEIWNCAGYEAHFYVGQCLEWQYIV